MLRFVLLISVLAVPSFVFDMSLASSDAVAVAGAKPADLRDDLLAYFADLKNFADLVYFWVDL
jgi:hypothetical protein